MDLDIKYEFDIFMQQILLGAMLKDSYFLKQSSCLIRPYYFQDSSHSVICDIIIEHFDKYKKIPNIEYLEQEIKEKFHDSDVKRDAHLYELKTIFNCYEPGLETREYLIDKVSEFAKIQTMRQAIIQVTDILGKKIENKWSKVYDIINNALSVDNKEEDGLDYFNTVEERYERMLKLKEHGEIFTSGFKHIDDALASGGLTRGELGCVMGQSGVGKSIALTKCAVHNVAQGKKVLYISLEMNSDKIALRADAQFSLIGINELFQNQDTVFEAIADQVSGKVDKKTFIIKQFASGTLDIKKLRAYMAQLALDGFKADILVLDYLGECSIRTDIPLHDALYYLVRDLRGLAVEENICVMTAIQANRGGKQEIEDGGIIDERYIGSSYGIIKPLDLLFSLNQSKHERLAGVGRVSVTKTRSGRCGFFFHYKMTDNLDLIEITQDVYAAKMNSIAKKADNIELPKKFKQNG